MMKKTAVTAALVAAIVGGGSAALASGSSASAAPRVASSGAGSTAGHALKEHHRSALKRAIHASWVTKDKKSGTVVTHQAIRGVATAVSASSITVKAADSTTETFRITTGTKVHLKGTPRTAAASISQVKVGDRAAVLGTGTSSLTAKRVLDRGTPSATGNGKGAAASPTG